MPTLRNLLVLHCLFGDLPVQISHAADQFMVLRMSADQRPDLASIRKDFVQKCLVQLVKQFTTIDLVFERQCSW